MLIQTAMFLTGCWINQSKLTTELYKRENVFNVYRGKKCNLFEAREIIMLCLSHAWLNRRSQITVDELFTDL